MLRRLIGQYGCHGNSPTRASFQRFGGVLTASLQPRSGPGTSPNWPWGPGTDMGQESPGSARGSPGGLSGAVSAGRMLSLREQAFGGLSRLIKRCAGTCPFGTADALTRGAPGLARVVDTVSGAGGSGGGARSRTRAPASRNARQAGGFALAW